MPEKGIDWTVKRLIWMQQAWKEDHKNGWQKVASTHGQETTLWMFCEDCYIETLCPSNAVA